MDLHCIDKTCRPRRTALPRGTALPRRTDLPRRMFCVWSAVSSPDEPGPEGGLPSRHGWPPAGSPSSIWAVVLPPALPVESPGEAGGRHVPLRHSLAGHPVCCPLPPGVCSQGAGPGLPAGHHCCHQGSSVSIG